MIPKHIKISLTRKMSDKKHTPVVSAWTVVHTVLVRSFLIFITFFRFDVGNSCRNSKPNRNIEKRCDWSFIKNSFWSHPRYHQGPRNGLMTSTSLRQRYYVMISRWANQKLRKQALDWNKPWTNWLNILKILIPSDQLAKNVSIFYTPSDFAYTYASTGSKT